MWHRVIVGAVFGAVSLPLAACGGSSGGGSTDTSTAAQSTSSSTTAGTGGKESFSNPTEINNAYLPITKFHTCVLAGNDEGQQLRIVRTLQSRTRPFTFGGQTVDAAVVTDRVTDVGAGQVIEKTLDYFAQDDAGIVYYFGEDVNEYENGKLTSHEGQWRLGRDTQTPGVLMPANPKVGDTFQSEDVKGVTHETDTVVSGGKTARIAGHTYHNVIKVRENAKPPPEIEFKQYARGTGVITEANGGVHLVGCH
jgi:hypothetical protein